MKTVFVFLILALIALNVKAAPAVEKPLVSGDNYQHQLTCQAFSPTDSEMYQVNVKWKVTYIPTGRAPSQKHAFTYEILNIASGQTWSRDYQDFFHENATVTNSQSLKLEGHFFMYKRLGTLSHGAILEFAKLNGGYQLQNLLLSAQETYENPIFDCEPYSKHCDDHSIAPKETVLQLEFSDSQCEYTAL